MTKAGKRMIAAAQEALTYVRLQAKADELLAAGDAAARAGNNAESRRLLRQCRRYRMKAREYAIEYTPPLSSRR